MARDRRTFSNAASKPVPLWLVDHYKHELVPREGGGQPELKTHRKCVHAYNNPGALAARGLLMLAHGQVVRVKRKPS